MQIVKAEAITCEIITDNNLSLSTLRHYSEKTLNGLESAYYQSLAVLALVDVLGVFTS